MPFVTAEDGVRIHYELEGSEGGVPLVLLHGFTGRIERWRQWGYTERLGGAFRLVLIDARGHGESDKPTHGGAYDMRQRVLDVVAVTESAGIDRSHVWGYAMGGFTAQSVSIYAPQRFRSITIGGASPYGARDAAMSLPFDEFWRGAAERPGAHRQAWEANFNETRRFSGAVQALRTTRLPYLLYAGTQDKDAHRGLREFVGKYGARHFALPDMDHPTVSTESAAEVVGRVTAFIDEVEAASK